MFHSGWFSGAALTLQSCGLNCIFYRFAILAFTTVEWINWCRGSIGIKWLLKSIWCLLKFTGTDCGIFSSTKARNKAVQYNSQAVWLPQTESRKGQLPRNMTGINKTEWLSCSCWLVVFVDAPVAHLGADMLSDLTFYSHSGCKCCNTCCINVIEFYISHLLFLVLDLGGWILVAVVSVFL